MTIFQLSSISPNATKEFGLVSSVSVIFTLVPYLYTCAALLLLGHGHFGKARPAYLAVTTIAFLYWHLGRGGVRGERGYVVICNPDGHHRHVCAELQPAA
ncbi:arginine/agmatine antiporter [Escherichia coli]|uniref:Arginine/agmatine antiporter n=1 Tax=Escherichia coli TaxID=562 RepID=A0A377B7I2_ECOLX|nr:arginine/agmatine antiporter [Escherichia coli]